MDLNSEPDHCSPPEFLHAAHLAHESLLHFLHAAAGTHHLHHFAHLGVLFEEVVYFLDGGAGAGGYAFAAAAVDSETFLMTLAEVGVAVWVVVDGAGQGWPAGAGFVRRAHAVSRWCCRNTCVCQCAMRFWSLGASVEAWLERSRSRLTSSSRRVPASSA